VAWQGQDSQVSKKSEFVIYRRQVWLHCWQGDFWYGPSPSLSLQTASTAFYDHSKTNGSPNQWIRVKITRLNKIDLLPNWNNDTDAHVVLHAAVTDPHVVLHAAVTDPHVVLHAAVTDPHVVLHAPCSMLYCNWLKTGISPGSFVIRERESDMMKVTSCHRAWVGANSLI